MGRSASAGFTTIELLTAVVIVAILAAIAIPSYSAYVVRGQRAAAKAALEQAAQFLERNYTTSGCYNFSVTTDCANQSGTSAVGLPAALTSSPNGGPAAYAITIATFTPPANFNNGQYFLLSAAPCSTSATACAGNGSFADPTCGALTLDNTGLQGIDTSGTGTQTPTTTGTAVSTCWQR